MDTQTDRRRQDSVTDMVADTMRKTKFWNVFDCMKCRKFWLGRDLHKNQNGEYVCLDCTHPVSDITSTPNGQVFLQIVAPELGSKAKTTVAGRGQKLQGPVSA